MNYVVLSFVAAAAAYGLLAIWLALTRQAANQGRWLALVVGGTALWSLVITVALTRSGGVPGEVTYAADALRTLLWTLCLLRALQADPGWQSIKRLLMIGATVLTLAAIVLPALLGGTQGAHFALLGSAVIGCLTIEQIFRNSTPDQQRVLKPFLWTMAAILGYDLFVFADAVLVGTMDPLLWALRGVFAASAVPFLALAAKRHPDWADTLFVSRKFVFYSAMLTGVGMYFIAMALVGALIRNDSGAWGATAQVTFSIAALVVLGFALSSARLRNAVRVFITKHFYRNQYEYRDEWLELIRTLSVSDSELPLDERGIKALCDIIDSSGGQMWLAKGPTQYEPFAAWRCSFPPDQLARNSALVRFLTEHGWVIDSEELERDPERYHNAFRDEPCALLENSIIVPLFHQEELLGVARLVRPRGHRALNYEDHDLLKTAGRQVAAFLAHDLAKEQLAETRQFEAYNKLSAFVVHDLKNLLSQQALLVENAKKHQHRPEFVADVIRTVDHGVQRMRRLLRQLEQDARAAPDQRVELNGLLKEVIAACKGGDVELSFAEQPAVWVLGRKDSLASVFTHMITNAKEASGGGSSIEVELGTREGTALVEIRDSGQGMTQEFVRRRLFKPFDTTKGYSGMGIGAYQAREIIRALGGDIVVRSAVGEGTTVLISLPVTGAGKAGRPLAEVAG